MNIGSGNGLLPDGTKPLPEPMLARDIQPNAMSQKNLQTYWLKLSYELFYFILFFYLPGDNEL